MSSPNEPGNGNGPPPPGPDPGGPVTDRVDVPPWQRGGRGRPQPPPWRPEAAPGPHPPAGGEERINRFISGPAPGHPQAPEPDAPPPPRSELPDLSTAVPRPSRPKPAGEAASPARKNRMQVRSTPAAAGPLRASMQLRRVDPWSVLKVSLVLSVAMFFVWMIAVAFLYLALGGMGVWARLNSNVGDLLNNTSNSELVSSGTIFGGAALIGLANIVLLTAMATVGAFIYNLTTDLVGGVEVTLADRD